MVISYEHTYTTEFVHPTWCWPKKDANLCSYKSYAWRLEVVLFKPPKVERLQTQVVMVISFHLARETNEPLVHRKYMSCTRCLSHKSQNRKATVCNQTHKIPGRVRRLRNQTRGCQHLRWGEDNTGCSSVVEHFPRRYQAQVQTSAFQNKIESLRS